jgi:hypothetical protein
MLSSPFRRPYPSSEPLRVMRLASDRGLDSPSSSSRVIRLASELTGLPSLVGTIESRLSRRLSGGGCPWATCRRRRRLFASGLLPTLSLARRSLRGRGSNGRRWVRGDGARCGCGFGCGSGCARCCCLLRSRSGRHLRRWMLERRCGLEVGHAAIHWGHLSQVGKSRHRH